MLAELGPAQFSLFLNFLNLSVKIQKDLKGHKKIQMDLNNINMNQNLQFQDLVVFKYLNITYLVYILAL